jgi:hypothetical protein
MIRIAIMLAVLSLLRQEDRELAEFKRETLKRESEGRWKKVAWQKDMAAALRKAQEGNKPVLAVIVVGHLGRKNAAEC